MTQSDEFNNGHEPDAPDEEKSHESSNIQRYVVIIVAVMVGCCCTGFGCSLADDIANIIR